MGIRTTQTKEQMADGTRLASELQEILGRIGRKDVPDEVTQRGQAIAEAIERAVDEAAERATEAWRESRPVRREAMRTLERQGREMGRWSLRVWRKDIRPGLRRAWSRRTVALGAAGAAVPAGRQIIEEAASELGIRPRRDRHWGTFFAGVVIGGLTGALIALLTAPKPGRDTRDELVVRAREAAETAGEWIPVSMPTSNGNGGTVQAPAASEVETEG
jgi:gas vesicle protein